MTDKAKENKALLEALPRSAFIIAQELSERRKASGDNKSSLRLSSTEANDLRASLKAKNYTRLHELVWHKGSFTVVFTPAKSYITVTVYRT